MSGTRHELYFLTFHGSLICFDRQRRALCHRRPSEVRPPVDRMMVTYEGDLAALPGQRLEAWRFAAGLYPGTVSLTDAGLFASAALDGSLALTSNECTGWESFLPVHAADYEVLLAVLAAEGRGFAKNFRLRMGDGVVVDLRRSLPLAAAVGGQVALTAVDGAPVLWRAPAPAAPAVPSPAAPAVPVPATPPEPAAAPELPVAPAVAAVPKIWLRPMGNTANRVLQYLAACGLRALVPAAEIENIQLPEWGLAQPAPPPGGRAVALEGPNFRFDRAGLADCLRRGVIDTIRLETFVFHLDHYPPREQSRRLLGPTAEGAAAAGFGAGQLVCSLRGGEVLHANHPDYLVLPPDYYQMLAARTGLELVFYGQLGDDAYCRSLREALPDAQFIQGRNPGYDFEVLRRSQNIALGLSTFSWAAAWLGTPARVFFPVAGFFNPVQHPQTGFLPLDCPDYEYVLFPFAKAVDVFAHPEAFFRQQRLLAAGMRWMTAEDMQLFNARAETLQPNYPLVTGFDPDFYLRRYPDALAFVKSGQGGALQHYMIAGFGLGYQPCAFDADFYVTTHAEAAVALAEGRYATPLAHYLAEGYARGLTAASG